MIVTYVQVFFSTCHFLRSLNAALGKRKKIRIFECSSRRNLTQPQHTSIAQMVFFQSNNKKTTHGFEPSIYAILMTSLLQLLPK